jgi:GH15 family glucan-1,4-alpha-glucosidase
MPRDLPLGNGSMLVNFDARYRLRDVYFPHVGQQNHTLGSLSRLGLWTEGRFTWLSDWALELHYVPDTLVTEVRGWHPDLGLHFTASDAVDCEANVLIRRFSVRDESGRPREVRLFVHFDPHIGESALANAAYFDAARRALVCYKGDRYFLLASEPPMSEYAVGTKGAPHLQGTWRDAEDGRLSNNAIASGFVDATLMLTLQMPAGGEGTGFVWLAAGRSFGDVTALHDLAQGAPAALLDRTARYWRFWLGRARRDFGDLSPGAADLYRRSLLIVRTQIDNNGAIIAANDADIVAFGMDHYSYVWPRDAALVAEALDAAGYHEVPRQFYVFLRTMLAQTNYALNGYLLHRYTPTGLVAASWHPGVDEGGLHFPIQEDETALVVYGLCRHVARTGDVELLRDLYRGFVRPAADFMLIFRDYTTGLPHPSYDLWEEKYGVFLFTCSTVFAALQAAAGVAEALGDAGPAQAYRAGAAELRAGAAEHFFDPELDRLVFRLHVEPDGTLRRDPELDSSMAGAFLFGLFRADDPRMVSTVCALRLGLENRPPVRGIARHGADSYQRVGAAGADYQGNAWFVSTLWLADWLTATGDRSGARECLEWCAAHALPSGVLAEQVHPETGAPLSVSPLTWSHAAFIASVERYLQPPAGGAGASPARSAAGPSRDSRDA